MVVKEPHQTSSPHAPEEGGAGTDTRGKELVSFWSDTFSTFCPHRWEETHKGAWKRHSRRLEAFIEKGEIPWLAGGCGGLFDRGTFGATSDSLIFIPRTRNAQDMKRLGRRYLIPHITDLTPDEKRLTFTYEGEVVRIPFPQAAWPLAMRFPGVLRRGFIVGPDEVQAAKAGGATKQLCVGCLAAAADTGKTGIVVTASATYTRVRHDVVFRPPSEAPYYQRLTCPECGTELWVRVQNGAPVLYRYPREEMVMQDAKLVDKVMAAASSPITFPRHQVLDVIGNPGYDKPTWAPPGV